MIQSDKDFIIKSVEKLLEVPICTLTNAEISKLKILIRKI